MLEETDSDERINILDKVTKIQVRLRALSHILLAAGKYTIEGPDAEERIAQYGLGEILDELADDATEARVHLDTLFVGKVRLEIASDPSH